MLDFTEENTLSKKQFHNGHDLKFYFVDVVESGVSHVVLDLLLHGDDGSLGSLLKPKMIRILEF